MTSHKINSHSYFVCNHPISGPTYAEMQLNRRSLCQICGGVAKGIYYTATSCKSCMDFFRRCVIFDKRYKVVPLTLDCSFIKDNGQCVGILVKEKCIENNDCHQCRRRCRSCRFQECYKVSLGCCLNVEQKF